MDGIQYELYLNDLVSWQYFAASGLHVDINTLVSKQPRT